ncbi:ferrochelatase [Eisenibacter elegans]|uniref:ferrochelatase n=1 Tax=Eisenibacter elegans TaxID=997 RepID=UPI00041578F0|nr:ferrochelatase [Eisenibacter elegans]
MNTSTKEPIGVLLVNLGTPDSPNTGDVRSYLRQFLTDARVIDIPAAARYALVNLIIAPFRAPKSAKVYKEVWLPEGSPIKVYGFEVEKMLQQALGDEYKVVLAMRYKNPSVEAGLAQMRQAGIRRLIVLPLFPQYASATTGSVQQEVMRVLSSWQIIPEVTFIHSFFDHPGFIQAFTEIGKRYVDGHDYDHYIFSYHGLPERQIRKGDDTGTCLQAAKADKSLRAKPNCCATLHTGNRSCYRAQCFATTRLLADALGIAEEDYTVCFQSRLGNDVWIQPYTEDVLKELPKQGKKRVLAFSPAFIADCLETTIEIGEEYKEMFEEAGGEHWVLVESLNTDPLWVATLEQMVREYSTKPQTLVANLMEG